jgi:hypothetical protein
VEGLAGLTVSLNLDVEVVLVCDPEVSSGFEVAACVLLFPFVDDSVGVSVFVDSGGGTAGVAFFVNMSRMLCRRSNSGISFADKGSRSFVLQSRRRFSPWNMPGGFTISIKARSSSPTFTLSEKVAKTGQ